MGAQTPVSLPQQCLAGRPVELQKVLQPAVEVRIATGTAQRYALQQPQRGLSRQPAVVAHPAVDAEQGHRQAAGIQADGDQMAERPPWLAAPEQMQMAVFTAAAMAVVVALAAAARVHQITRRVMLQLHRRAASGEGPQQRAVTVDQTEPMEERLACRPVARNGALPGAEGCGGVHHPPSARWSATALVRPTAAGGSALAGGRLRLRSGRGFRCLGRRRRSGRRGCLRWCGLGWRRLGLGCLGGGCTRLCRCLVCREWPAARARALDQQRLCHASSLGCRQRQRRSRHHRAGQANAQALGKGKGRAGHRRVVRGIHNVGWRR